MLEFQKKQDLEEELLKEKKKAKLFSILRFIIALADIVFLLCLLSLTEYILYGILTGVFFILFLALVVLSNPTYKRVTLLENKKKVYERHNQRRNKNFSHFKDQGTEFKNKEDYKLADLDVFGSKSLYQYLSEAKTPLGRSRLAKQLSNPDALGLDFTKFVDTLSKNEESLELEAALMEFQKGSGPITTDEFTSLVSNPIKFKAIHFIPLASVVLMLVYVILIFVLGFNPYALIAFLFLNLITTKLCLNQEILKKDTSSYYYLSDLYYDLANVTQKTEIDDPYYQDLKQKINSDLPTLKKIRSIYTSLNLRKNIIINIAFNLLFSYDIFLLFILKYRIKNGLCLKESLDSIALLEVALSLKNIGMDNPYATIPSYGDLIIGEEMYHPFVKNCIPNTLSLDGGIVLTGSNMSGKTTFMRTLGVAVILHNACGIVPAKCFSSPNPKIYTSLRANDMLQEGVSTFYAEIKRMKLINDAIKQEKCLILVDEIFKGTNAMERIMASQKVIYKLNTYHASFIISTHDFELCETKDIKNYHFEENYQDDKICFDYKLKEGSLTKGNAIYLLKMSGIIENE